MLAPRIFTENLFDDLFDDFPFRSMENVDRKLYGKHYGREMLTDVREHDNGYEVVIDLPGFKKDEIKVELNDGYMTITAAKGVDEDEKDSKGRPSGKICRSNAEKLLRRQGNDCRGYQGQIRRRCSDA